MDRIGAHRARGRRRRLQWNPLGRDIPVRNTGDRLLPPSLPSNPGSPQVARRSSMRDIDHSRRPARLVALMAGVTLFLGACNGGGSHKSAVTTTGNQATTTRATPRPVQLTAGDR